jgi:alpha-mannosidase
MGWRRDDVLTPHVTLYGEVSPSDLGPYRKGLRLMDERGGSVPFYLQQFSENISRALEIVFVARDVPSLGYKSYYLLPADGQENGRQESNLQIARFTSDRENDVKEFRRPFGADVIENGFYRVTVDKATGRIALFDQVLGWDVIQGMEIVATEERGGNYAGVEPVSGRIIPTSIDQMDMEENNAARAVYRINGHTIDIPMVQRLTLYKDAKRLDIETAVEWNRPPYLRLEQLFPCRAANARIQCGVTFGANAADDLLPNSGPHLADEISKDSWLGARQVQDWIFAGNSDWSAAIGTDHQFVRLDAAIYARRDGARHAFHVGEGPKRRQYQLAGVPPPDTYRFRYSLSSGAGDWQVNKSYDAGLNFNHRLIPVRVVDEVSRKTLPPSHSFLPLEADGIVLSAVKKAGAGTEIVLRLYENTGRPSTIPVSFLGRNRRFREVNLLEEDMPASELRQTLTLRFYELKTIRLQTEPSWEALE